MIEQMQAEAALKEKNEKNRVNSSLAAALEDGVQAVMNDDDLIQECEDEGEFD